MYTERLSITPRAIDILGQVRQKHGDVIFHQSGGCCDGSSPMCLKKEEFLIGARDVYLGTVDNCSFYIASDQFSYFKNMHITIDVVEGRGASFSLEIPLGYRFITVSRLFTDNEIQSLEKIRTQQGTPADG